MREIKFRLWVVSILPEETGMYIPEYISWAKNGSIHDIDKVFTEEYKFKEDTCKFTLMQYTGLKDKNGKEIYEGDIVKTYHRVGSIGWSDKWHSWTLDSFTLHQFDHPEVQLEVIGNIYENRELLEVKK